MNSLIRGNQSGYDDNYYWPIRDQLSVVIPITVVHCLIFIVGVFGNVITCMVIVKSRYLHSTTNYFLFSLAISDLLLLLSGLPPEMYSIWRRYPDPFGETFCILRGFASETSANATVLTITAFTVERYLAVCRPRILQKWQNNLTTAVRQICLIWIASFILAIPQALQLGLVPIMPGMGSVGLICSVKRIVVQHSFEISTFVFFVGPMILIAALYCQIGLTLCNATHHVNNEVRIRVATNGEIGHSGVIKMLVAVVTAFFICWAPFHAQRLLAIWGMTWLESSPAVRQTYHILTYISGVLYYLSTCINPILYHIMSLKFRHAFQGMVSYKTELAKQRREHQAIHGRIYERRLSTRSARCGNIQVVVGRRGIFNSPASNDNLSFD